MSSKKAIFKSLFTLIFIFSLFSCNGQNTHIPEAVTSAAPIRIDRFDKEVLKLIENGDTAQKAKIDNQFPQMLNILGKGVLNMQSTTVPGFFDKLINYYSEPTLKELYQNAVRQFENVSEIEQSLGNGFAWLKACFPSMTIPAVCMHVSGFNQNILAGDSLVSISIDKYLGANYPLYQDFFYDYQRRQMIPELIVPDYLTGWLMSEYPFEGKENVLLDRMIYEGKIKYLVQKAMPKLSPELLLGYTDTDYKWCKENEGNIWKAIIERKHLYTPDQMTTAKYFEDEPSQFLANDAPGNLGIYIGWQIIDKYMNETNTTPEALMSNNNSQEILTASKYKPY